MAGSSVLNSLCDSGQMPIPFTLNLRSGLPFPILSEDSLRKCQAPLGPKASVSLSEVIDGQILISLFYSDPVLRTPKRGQLILLRTE